MDCYIFIPEDWEVEVEFGFKIHKIIFRKGKENIIAIQIPKKILNELLRCKE